MITKEYVDELLDALDGVEIPSFIDNMVELALRQMETTNNYSAIRPFYINFEDFTVLSREEKKKVLIKFTKECGYWSYMDDKYHNFK